MTRVIGLTKGHTVLPASADTNVDIEDPDKRKEALYGLESSIITWTEQIEAVLRTSPDDILEEDSTAGALKQIDFWEVGLKNNAV